MVSSISVPPPPRRKSCSACVKAKRRCDQLAPTCSRCIEKNLACTYVRRSSGTKINSTPAYTTSESTALIPNLTTSPLVCPPGDLQLDFAMDPGLITELFDRDSSRFFEVDWGHHPGCGESVTNVQPYAALMTPPSTPAYQQEDYRKMDYVCVRFILVSLL